MRGSVELLREALRKAARSAPANLTTVLVEDGHTLPRKPWPDDSMFPVPGSKKPSHTSSEIHQASRTSDPPQAVLFHGEQASGKTVLREASPLAALLGYDLEDGDDDASRSPSRTHSLQQTPRSARAGSCSGDSSLQTAQEGAAQQRDGKDALDLELALFMEQLESDGLLKDTESCPDVPVSPPGPSYPPPSSSLLPPNPAPQLQPSAHQPVTQPTASHVSDHASSMLHATPGQVGGQEQVEQQHLVSLAPGMEHSSGAGQVQGLAGGAEAGEGEQVVLGYLRGNPSWSACLDAASSQVYYWHLVSNEVVWEVP
ncbi:hypothetical protein V8C86DRAFT_2475560, partial [Haematococcus lacustris]